jgi:uncharacterized membrane protein YidH (DUF202 family)
MTRPPDAGLQVERTAMAWIRTSLSLILVALIAFRFTVPHSLPLALGLAGVVTPLALLAIWLAWRRFRTSAVRIRDGAPLPDGVLPVIVTAVTVLTGVLGLVYVLLES